MLRFSEINIIIYIILIWISWYIMYHWCYYSLYREKKIL